MEASSVGEEIRRIGGRKYLLRFGRLPAKDEGPEHWKVDLHRIWLGRPIEEPEFCLVRSTKEALMQALQEQALEEKLRGRAVASPSGRNPLTSRGR